MKLQISIDGTAYEVDVEVVEEDEVRPPAYFAAPASATVQSTSVPLPLTPVPLGPGVEGGNVCRSPVAGIVTRVNTQPGQELQTDDLLIVLEAMKMETNVTAPSPGKVKAVKVHEGEAVKINQVLVEFD